MIPPTRSRAKFIALEGADGAGKSRLARLAVQELARRGQVAEIVNYRSMTGIEHFDAMIDAARTLFAREHFNATPLNAMSLASAAQYSLICAGAVRPSLDRNVILIADGWRFQTYARLLVEATRVFRLSGPGRQTWGNWLGVLFQLDVDLRTEPKPCTIAVAAPREDRQRWYTQTASRELIFDETGSPSTDAEQFGAFTEEIQEVILTLARSRGWPQLMNSSSRSPDSAADELIDLVTRAPYPECSGMDTRPA